MADDDPLLFFEAKMSPRAQEFGKHWPREFARPPPPQSKAPFSFDHKLYNVMAEAGLFFVLPSLFSETCDVEPPANSMEVKLAT